MLMQEIDGAEFAPENPELIGRRVLVAGVRGELGLEIVKCLAGARTRLVVHTDGDSATMAALQAASKPAMDAQVISHAIDGHGRILEMAREAVQRFGGLDAAINLVHVTEPPLGMSDAGIERHVNDLLALPCLVSRVIANRMRTMLAAGAILNIIVEDRAASPRARTIAQVARAVLSGLTRSDAQEWAAAGIRVNAIAPAAVRSARDNWLTGTPDVATLAMHLASTRGERLSGLTFEAYFG